MAINEALMALAEIIRDETEIGANTAARVGGCLVDIITELGDKVDGATLAQYIEDNLAKLGTGKILDWDEARVVFLDSMGATLDNVDGDLPAYTPQIGDVYYTPNNPPPINEKLSDGISAKPAKEYVVYINKRTLHLYQWDGSAMVEFGKANGVNVVNNLNGGSADDALSAKQGKVIKDNLEILNANIQALYDALANYAFISLPKPTLQPLDYSGTKYSVTVNNTLTGCTADKSGLQQVSEGSSLVVTITASAGNLLRSVTAPGATVEIAADNESATVTLANVTADATLAITATATAKGSFTASISDSRVDGTGADSGIVEGSAWSSELSLNGTAEEGASITAISASMAGGGSIEVNGNTVSTDYVTGDITITVTVAIAYQVNNRFINMSSDGDATAASGEDYTANLSAINSATSNNDLRVYVGGVLKTLNTDYTFADGLLTILAAAVTGDIDIIATAYTGTISVHSTTAVTGGITINNVAKDLDEGDNTFTGYSSITALSFSNNGKSAIDAIDFGGLKYTGSMMSVFRELTALESLYGLVVNGTTTMQYAFYGSNKLKNIDTIGWKTTSVSSWAGCFQGCSKLTTLDASYLVGASATSLASMFAGTSVLTSIAGINTWNVRNVTTMEGFLNNTGMTTLDIRNWVTTSSLTNLNSAFVPIGTMYIGDFNTTSVSPSLYVSTKSPFTLHCISETPPAVNSGTTWLDKLYGLTSNSASRIIVPATDDDSVIDAYKAASGWSTYSSKIIEES